jgi:SAM-dependent methyltransferase
MLSAAQGLTPGKEEIALIKKSLSKTYDRFAPFYDLEYTHKDDDIPFYSQLSEEYGPPILEIGVGTARVALPLAEAGHQVWGIDSSAKMLHNAQEKFAGASEDVQKNVHLIAADMRSFALKKQFPLCIIPFRAFLHNLTVNDQIASLRNIHQHLTANGILAFDLFVPLYQVLTRSEWEDEIGAEELADPQCGITIRSKIKHDPVRQLLRIQNTYSETNKKERPHNTKCEMYYRYVFRFEMELLLKIAGFEVLGLYGGFDFEDYNYFSGTMAFVARKA